MIAIYLWKNYSVNIIQLILEECSQSPNLILVKFLAFPEFWGYPSLSTPDSSLQYFSSSTYHSLPAVHGHRCTPILAHLVSCSAFYSFSITFSLIGSLGQVTYRHQVTFFPQVLTLSRSDPTREPSPFHKICVVSLIIMKLKNSTPKRHFLLLTRTAGSVFFLNNLGIWE